jgi:hypothetical protein
MARWRKSDERVIRLHFRDHGAAGCAPYLPGRSLTSIWAKAQRMGVKCDLSLRNSRMKPASHFRCPTHAHPLVRELFAHMRQHHMSLKRVSAKAGIAHGCLNSWASRRVPQLANFEAACNAAGLKIKLEEYR